MHDHPHTPGPQGAEIELEELAFTGAGEIDEDSDPGFTFARGQYLEVTVRGYVGKIAETERPQNKRELSVRSIGIKVSSLASIELLAAPAPRPTRDGQVPGQESMPVDAAAEPERAVAEAIEESAAELGVTATVDQGALDAIVLTLPNGEHVRAGDPWVHQDGWAGFVKKDQADAPEGMILFRLTTPEKLAGNERAVAHSAFGVELGRWEHAATVDEALEQVPEAERVDEPEAEEARA